MRYSDPTREFYEACNRTELYQLCARVGLVVSPAAPREKLVSYLLGVEEPPSLEHPVHVWRNGLIGLIQDYWTGIEAQLRCPAKELGPPARDGEPEKPDPSDYKSPIACYRCVETRVISCLVENEPHEGLIQLHRKMTIPPRKDNDMGTTGMLTLETAPRTIEGMNVGDGVGRGMLKRLWDALVNDGAAPGDEKSMVAFVDANTDLRREMVVRHLAAWDQMKGRPASQGSIVPASASPGSPAPTPVVGGAQAAAGAPAEAVPARTPSNRGKRAQVPADVAPGAEGGPSEEERVILALSDALSGIKTMLQGISAQGLKLEEIAAIDKANAIAASQELLTAISGLNKSVKTLAAITLWQIEEKMDTSPSEVLSQAGAYITIFDRALAVGKA